jgi:prepilin-type N-terminal cleavage/methylation domain-containing protein
MIQNLSIHKENRGFTLVEIIAVLVILSVLAAVVAPRMVGLDISARLRGLEYGIAELNGRESLSWANVKLSNSGWLNDGQVWQLLDTDLGDEYGWDGAPTDSGGRLEFKEAALDLVRNKSTYLDPALWQK